MEIEWAVRVQRFAPRCQAGRHPSRRPWLRLQLLTAPPLIQAQLSEALAAAAESASRLEKKGRKQMTWAHTSASGERGEVAGAFWTMRKYGGLRVDPRASKTYKMAYLS